MPAYILLYLQHVILNQLGMCFTFIFFKKITSLLSVADLNTVKKHFQVVITS